MKIFRTILGVLFLLIGLLVIGERLYYSHFEMKTLYFSIPVIIFGCLFLYHRGNKFLFAENKILKVILTFIFLFLSTVMSSYMVSLSCGSKNRCDYTVGYPFPMFIGTDTSTGLLGIATFILGIFLNFVIYHLLSALIINLFRKKFII